MTVTTEQSSKSFNGNDVTVDFPTGFRFLDSSHLTVTLDDDLLTEGVDYTVDGEGDTDGGTITTTDPVASGSVLHIERNTPALQEVALRSQGTFLPAVHEEMVDRLTMMIQEDRRRSSALEALGSLIDVSDVNFGGAIVSADFATDAEGIETTFPLAVASTGGSTATDAWCTRLQNLDDPSEVFDEPPAIQWTPGTGDHISLLRVSGLKPDTSYRIRICVLVP